MKQYITITQDKNTVSQLKELARMHPGRVAFSTSFGLEDQVIGHMIFSNAIPIRVFTLDTGRLFTETYQVWQETINKYGQPIEAFYPDMVEVEKMVSQKGPFSFYESLENRKECCNIRKVVPLQRALSNVDVWITGLRADQSSARSNLAFFEHDAAFGLVKFNPLKDWSLSDLKVYIEKHNVPYNKLHDQGFVSIGCQPCTRAIKNGEDFRAGRWWWEASAKECGLHATRTAEPIVKVKKI
jgi:phosphoadenosine phosphosulfate reductase